LISGTSYASRLVSYFQTLNGKPTLNVDVDDLYGDKYRISIIDIGVESLQGKSAEIVVGINLGPDETYSFLQKAPLVNSSLRIVDKDARRIRFSWSQNNNEEYNFDISISYEGSLCDLHFTPADSDSTKLANAVASIVEVMSSHGGIRIGELRDYTEAEKEPPTDEDVQKVAAYLQEHVIANLEQISSSLGMLHLNVSMCLHRLIDNGVIGCSPIGTSPARLFYFK
jgi:hypothetical protein